MTGYLYPEMKRVVLDVENGGQVYLKDQIIVIISEHYITTFSSRSFEKLA